MLRPTVFTSSLFAVVLILLAAAPVHARHFLPYDVVERAASKAANALGVINKGGLRARQQSYAPGNPQYLADVVAWACDTVSPDLQDRCVIDLFVDPTQRYCWDLLTLSGPPPSKIRQSLTATRLRMSSPSVWSTSRKIAPILRFRSMTVLTSRELRFLNGPCILPDLLFADSRPALPLMTTVSVWDTRRYQNFQTARTPSCKVSP